MTAWQIFTV